MIYNILISFWHKYTTSLFLVKTWIYKKEHQFHILTDDIYLYLIHFISCLKFCFFHLCKGNRLELKSWVSHKPKLNNKWKKTLLRWIPLLVLMSKSIKDYWHHKLFIGMWQMFWWFCIYKRSVPLLSVKMSLFRGRWHKMHSENICMSLSVFFFWGF